LRGGRGGWVQPGAAQSGSRQVEYDGHPLYLYAGDSALRQIEGSGNGTDGTWFAVTPNLKPVG
jgi:predicted lipoprotein with Yx(FWY)xxD motif